MGKSGGSHDPRAEAAARLRRLIPIGAGLLILLIIILIATAPRSGRGVDATVATPTKEVQPPAAEPDSTPTDSEQASAAAAPAAEPDPAKPLAPAPAPPPAPATSGDRALEGLHVLLHQIDPSADPLPVLGGLDDPAQARMRLQFSQQGAGIVEIPFANIWTTAAAKRQASEWYAARGTDRADALALPPHEDRLILAKESLVPMGNPPQLVTIPLLAARSVTVGTTELNLVPAECWKPTGPGSFVAEVRNAADEPIIRVERHWSLDEWDIELGQRIINVSGVDLGIRWSQYGPPNLTPDRSRYMDRRRMRFGYLLGEKNDPDRLAGVVADGAMLLELTDVTKENNSPLLWPNDVSREEGFELSWFASTNRYFALAIHPLLDAEGRGDLSFKNVVSEITRYTTTINDEAVILTGLVWPPPTGPAAILKAGDTKSLSMGVYAGPLEKSILGGQQPYKALNMQGLILYQMSSFCAICTFQWLAHILLAVLAFFDHWVVFDWGIAIILLVICVRALLHPITRRSQMGMQKFGKQMQRLKPEIDKLQKKYPGDKKKVQEEQMRLFRERGINPLQMLGCLPMFLQMPIWVALYAGLYFSFDLRQEPAFWGVFQNFWNWPFLADLASPDHFFWEAPEPFKFLLWNITGINLLPLLMGAVFFFQQKYMTPQTSMSAEQETQQKIMRVMMVVLFPVMLYSAPSGLTLYILTSSTVGILESRHIRKQVDAMDLDAMPSKAKPAVAGARVAKDPQARAYAKMMERRKQKKNKGPEKNFKKRK
ncbi:MAG: membrane protein insertase YidC [Phycisphaerales bacterium]|nr:membrane protein insertase YidC [Phycisphaerales bacterium]